MPHRLRANLKDSKSLSKAAVLYAAFVPKVQEVQRQLSRYLIIP